MSDLKNLQKKLLEYSSELFVLECHFRNSENEDPSELLKMEGQYELTKALYDKTSERVKQLLTQPSATPAITIQPSGVESDAPSSQRPNGRKSWDLTPDAFAAFPSNPDTLVVNGPSS